MFGLIRRTFQGYGAATKIAPEWTVANLVFQAGVPRSRMGSITGGGQIYGHEYQGTFQPLIAGYSPGISAIMGSGQILANPPFLTPLFGGQTGIGS